MVTVVDHLGNVSANLDGLISHTNATLFVTGQHIQQATKQTLFSKKN